jgi:hypothetical protein
MRNTETGMATEKAVAKKAGRPPITVDYDLAERAAMVGLTNEQIALILGICRDSLHNKMQKEPELVDAIDRGRAHGIHTMAHGLYQAGINGNVVAAIFWLKSRAGWKEAKDEVEGAEVKITVAYDR